MSVHRPRYSGVLCCVVLLFAQSRPTSSFAADEKARYVALYNQYAAGGFGEGIRLVVQAVLVSPSFLYHAEFDATPQTDLIRMA